MKVLISGASGLVGLALVPSLESAGHQAVRLVRRRPVAEAAVFWNPAAQILDPSGLAGIDAVVHLAGENIARGRWTARLKRRIRDSRVLGTRFLARTLAAMDEPPRTLICASAVGFYGDRGEELLDEEQAAGEGFLAEVCRLWEEAAEVARQRGLRVVYLRLGVVLSRRGGALKRMLPAFRVGLGGVLGGGEQYMSWIAVPDLVAAIGHVLEREDLSGAINAVAPEPVTNRQLTGTLAQVLGRRVGPTVPALAVRLLFGEMGRELFLASTRVVPRRLSGSGFVFRFPELAAALHHELGQRSGVSP